MWRVTMMVKRRSDLAPDDFQSGWCEVLAPEIAQIAQQQGATHCILNFAPEHYTDAMVSAFPAAHDGLLELWFDETDEATRAMIELTASLPVKELGESLLDRSRSIVWLAQARLIKPETGTAFRFFVAGDVAEGLTVADGQRYYFEQHPVTIRGVPTFWDRMTYYCQFHGIHSPESWPEQRLATGPMPPLCSELGFASFDMMQEAFADEAYAQIIRPDEEKFCRPDGALCFYSTEQRVVGAR